MAVDITKPLKKYVPVFRQAQDQGINESETSLRISKFLEAVLDYDLFKEVSREQAVKDRFVDYAIKLNGKTVFMVEVKQAAITLKEKHIEQAANYAANAGVPWVALTNGAVWQLYHLTFDDGIESDLVWETNILGEDLKDAVEKIGLLHRKNILKGEHEEYFAKIKTLTPRSILQAIFQEDTLKRIRAHLKKTSGVRVEESELAAHIKKMLSPETCMELGDIKIKRKRPGRMNRKECGAGVSTSEATSCPASLEAPAGGGKPGIS